MRTAPIVCIAPYLLSPPSLEVRPSQACPAERMGHAHRAEAGSYTAWNKLALGAETEVLLDC